MGFSRSRVGGGGVVRVVVGGGCLVAVLDLLSVQACWCLLCIHVEFMQSIWDLEISRCHVLQGVIGAVCSCFCGLRCIHVSHCRPLTYLIREVQYIHRIPQMPLGSRLWASMSFTLSCSWIAAGLMDAALQYSPCCVFQSTHKHRAAFPNTVMLCCELSEAWAGGWRLQALWGAALDESLYWDLLRTVWSFFFSAALKKQTGVVFYLLLDLMWKVIEPETAVLPNWRPKWEKEWQTSLHAKRNASLVLVPQHEDFL